jgi:hypothetical protein
MRQDQESGDRSEGQHVRPEPESQPGSGRHAGWLLDESGAGARLEPNLAERGFVLAHILLQHIQQGFGLLRADVDPLEIMDLHVFRRGLVDIAKHQKKVPKVDPDLHAVGVAFAVVGRFVEYDPGLGRCHRTTWYRNGPVLFPARFQGSGGRSAGESRYRVMVLAGTKTLG